MQRRTVIVGLAGIGAAGVGGYLWFAQPSSSKEPSKPPKRRPIPGLDSVFWLPIAALLPEGLKWQPLGERLVKRVHEKDIESLVQALGDTPGFLQLKGDTLRDWLVDQAKVDFKADKQVTVKGWHFARTEARMMALIWHLRERDREKEREVESSGDQAQKKSGSPSDQESAVVVPLGDAARGEKLYEEHCQSCHQADGRGVGGKVAADLNGADGPLVKSNEELFEVISEGIQGQGEMPAMGDTLDDQQIGDVIAWIRKRFGAKTRPPKGPKQEGH